ncbi:MAG TPA: H/ACA RNA-protein complex protein Gar1 [Desulfurococcales archaeon]|nr:H/ACA RNA-protein complex protein Gar1 [Desulfurococcales archaeon]
MRKLGTVLHKSKSGYLVVKLVNVPPLGVKVYDSKLNYIGVVKDVIGPVKDPYALVKVTVEGVNEEALTNTTLYFFEPKKSVKSARRRHKSLKHFRKGKRGG